MKTIDEQLEDIRQHVWDEDRAALLRMNEDNENRAVLAERVPQLCDDTVEAREMTLDRLNKNYHWVCGMQHRPDDECRG